MKARLAQIHRPRLRLGIEIVDGDDEHVVAELELLNLQVPEGQSYNEAEEALAAALCGALNRSPAFRASFAEDDPA